MEFAKRKTVNDNLSKYDCLSNSKSDFIEVSEWANGEGITVSINDDREFSITYGQLDAINYLTLALRYEDIKE